MQLYSIFQEHPIVCTDSRNCPAGSIFFALKGDNFNANAFALSALENGCSYAVIDEAEYALDERFVAVNNVLESLQQLATFHRKLLGTTIIGITGTNGKTTTKELIASVLTEKYNIHFTKGNLNNHIGVPLTLLQLKPEHEMAVIEMGANHPGDIKELVEISLPDYGIITNVGKAHLEGFGSFEGVMNTKAEMYDFITDSGKNIFINAGNDHLIQMARKSGVFNKMTPLKYSLDNNDEGILVSGKVTACSPFLEMELFTIKNSGFRTKTALIGTYNAENVLSAAIIGHFFGLTDEQIKNGLEKYIPNNNRSQFTKTNRNSLVIDAYNANPTSMHAAILNFAQMNVPSKVVILGDMLELGQFSETEHQNVVDLLKQNNFSAVLLVGNQFKKTRNNYVCFEHVDELISYIDNQPIDNQFILIKGSRGIRLEKVISKL